MTEGYLYCFSNASMPGLLKIGMTERTPDIRLNEANKPDTWKPPAPYVLEIAKKVSNPRVKELTLHKILSKYALRENPNREFFRISIEEVIEFFNLIDGDVYMGEIKESLEEVENTLEEEDNLLDYESDSDEDYERKSKPIGRRDMTKCFAHQQKISHTIGTNTWIGEYDLFSNEIRYQGKRFGGRSPLNQFAKAHYEEQNKYRISVNAWAECQCEIDGKWVSTYNL
jgi:hypothetical protein